MSQLAVGVLLARLLTPADFGLMTLGFLVLAVVQPLGDLGIGSAIVQRATISDSHVRTAFTFSVLLGLGGAAMIALTAPVGAFVMRDPGVAPVLRGLAASYAAGGMGVVAGALLQRRMDFKRKFFIDAVSYLSGYGGVATVLALTGHGVWSLVWGNLVQTSIASCGLLVTAQHPARPLLARRELRELLQFGVGSSLSACVNYVARNADNIVVGRSMGATSLGIYSRAYNLMNLPHSYAASMMSNVLFPAIAQAQGDQARVRRVYLLLTRLAAIVAGPAMGTLAVVAPHLVTTLYGPQWTGAVFPLQILCVAGYFRALYHIGGVVAQGVGRVYGELRNQAVYAILVIGGSLLGLRYGLPGVAAAVSVAIIYMFFATAMLASSATGAALSSYWRVQVGAFVTAGVTCAFTLTIQLGLESWRVSSGLTTLLALVAAAIPWSAGMLWTLGEPDVEPLRARSPRWCKRLVAALRRRTELYPRRPMPGSDR